MKIAAVISSIITLLLLLSTMICGLWLKSGQPGDISFHMNCGIASLVFCCITFILLLVTFHYQKKGK